MSTTSSSRRPSPAGRTLLLLGLPAVLAMGSVASPFAQSSPGGHMPPPGHHHRPMSRDLVEGPASPAILRDSIQLSGDKLKQYTSRYDAYMASTKPARDSLRATLQALRSSPQGGNRSGTEERRDTLRHQADQLAKRDKEFEKGLKNLLNADQQKRYTQWKENREKAQEKNWHRHGQRGDSASQKPQR